MERTEGECSGPIPGSLREAVWGAGEEVNSKQRYLRRGGTPGRAKLGRSGPAREATAWVMLIRGFLPGYRAH